MKVTPTGTLTERARELGEQHAAAGIAPFGDAEFVRWDAGSADLMTALGETGSAAGDNEPERRAAAEAYCDALEDGPQRRAARFAAIFEQESARWGLPSLADFAGGSR
jgi:hypothetical protein